MTGTLTQIQVGSTVRGLVEIQIEGYASPCTPGYQYTVQSVNDDGTITVYRDECAGKKFFATVPLSAVEPAYKIVGGTYYSSRADDGVISVMEQARACGWRIRISHGYTEKDVELGKTSKPVGQDWMEEWDIEGTISRSMGPVKVPLLIKNSRSLGGGACDGASIVKIRLTGKNGRVLYQHPKYRLPTLEIRAIPEKDILPDTRKYLLTHEVLADGEMHARFSSEKAAQRFVDKF